MIVGKVKQAAIAPRPDHQDDRLPERPSQLNHW
jgi:hypothetical protein